MIVMGIAQGMQPITGYNFGAGLVTAPAAACSSASPPDAR